jgi:hypothetical protein
VLVAGRPPVALLLAVELLAHRSRPRDNREIASSTVPDVERDGADKENPEPTHVADNTDPGSDGEVGVETSGESAVERVSPLPWWPRPGRRSRLLRRSCGRTICVSRPADGSRPVRSWTGWRPRTTTGARCCGSGVSRAASPPQTGATADQSPHRAGRWAMSGQRAARPVSAAPAAGRRSPCSPARTGPEFGYCGLPDGGDRTGLCPFCGHDRHRHSWGDAAPCPRYRLQSDLLQATGSDDDPGRGRT